MRAAFTELYDVNPTRKALAFVHFKGSHLYLVLYTTNVALSLDCFIWVVSSECFVCFSIYHILPAQVFPIQIDTATSSQISSEFLFLSIQGQKKQFLPLFCCRLSSMGKEISKAMFSLIGEVVLGPFSLENGMNKF